MGAAGRYARRLGARPRAFRSCRRAEDAQALDYLFYVGSAESFDPRGAEDRAPRSCKILKHAGVTIRRSSARARPRPASACAAPATRCCSSSSRARWSTTLNGLGVTRIVTCDPHAFNTLQERVSGVRRALRGRASHAADRAAASPRAASASTATFERVIYHEPCYLARHNGEYEAPRAILARLTRDAPLEFELRREKAMCCGAGGGRMWMEEKIGTRINVTRVEQALPQQPKVIATACPYCATMMLDGLKRSAASERLRRATSPSWSLTRSYLKTVSPLKRLLVVVPLSAQRCFANL